MQKHSHKLKKKEGADSAYLNDLCLLAGRLSFPKEDLSLLQQALTHPTFFEGQRHVDDDDNQRLEFLGDAVLDLMVGEYLYQHYPLAREGDLSKMRSVIVCEASFAAKARELGISRVLRLGHGAEAEGDRERPSVLADAFEAVVGAMFLCTDGELVKQFVIKEFGERMDSLTRDDYEDKKSLLQELIQRYSSCGVHYRLLHRQGPDHAPVFVSGAYCDRLSLGEGSGKSKKESEVAAAASALADKDRWLPALQHK